MHTLSEKQYVDLINSLSAQVALLEILQGMIDREEISLHLPPEEQEILSHSLGIGKEQALSGLAALNHGPASLKTLLHPPEESPAGTAGNDRVTPYH